MKRRQDAHRWNILHKGCFINTWSAIYLRLNVHSGNTIYSVVYILSRTTAIPCMVRQGDALVYYLLVILLLWNILTHTTEVMSVNKLGKMCEVMWMASRIVKNSIILSFVSIWWKILTNVLKWSWMSKINMFNQKLPNWKKNCLFGNI